jgi:uncharacterized protein (DUF58 family)
MRIRAIPSVLLVSIFGAMAAAALFALLLGVSIGLVALVTVQAFVALVAVTIADFFLSRRAWRESNLALKRKMPASLAVGVETAVTAQIDNAGALEWSCRFFDHADPVLVTEGLPVTVTLAPQSRLEITYRARATRRGDVTFAPAELLVRSRWALLELYHRLGDAEQRRVYPNFAELARFAWLTGNNRLNEIGIKTFHTRGAGTDFKQLTEYQPGDPIRHIDWKATQRLQKPIVREFQDERDQRVMFLIDCGRRMRADDQEFARGATHFDQVLNAVMLLAYVALKRGDAVGAMTFGTPPSATKMYAPTKGLHALDEMMGELYAVQPTPTHSDYTFAAEEFMRRQVKRALVVVITNFRDEDSAELGDALKLLRSRHLVLLSSLRERIVREIIEQPLVDREAAINVASGHVYEQARRDAFNRLAARDALMIDVEPQRLGVELVNRYNAVKKSGRL